MESFHPSPCSSRLLGAVCYRSRQKLEHLEENSEEQEGRFAWDADPQVGGTPAPATEAARELAPPHPQTLAGGWQAASAPSESEREGSVAGMTAEVGRGGARDDAQGGHAARALSVELTGEMRCCRE